MSSGACTWSYRASAAVQEARLVAIFPGEYAAAPARIRTSLRRMASRDLLLVTSGGAPVVAADIRGSSRSVVGRDISWRRRLTSAVRRVVHPWQRTTRDRLLYSPGNMRRRPRLVAPSVRSSLRSVAGRAPFLGTSGGVWWWPRQASAAAYREWSVERFPGETVQRVAVVASGVGGGVRRVVGPDIPRVIRSGVRRRSHRPSAPAYVVWSIATVS